MMDAKITDLTPLANMKGARRVGNLQDPVTDLSPLKDRRLLEDHQSERNKRERSQSAERTDQAEPCRACRDGDHGPDSTERYEGAPDLKAREDEDHRLLHPERFSPPSDTLDLTESGFKDTKTWKACPSWHMYT